MTMKRPANATNRTGVVVFTTDPAFEQLMQATFKVSAQIDLQVVGAKVTEIGSDFVTEGVTVIVVDLDAGDENQMLALERLVMQVGSWPPVVVVAQSFDAELARRLLQMRVADFMVKPVQPLELVRTCARVARPTASESKEAQIYTFLPAVGGAGVTTIAIQTAMLLRNSGSRGRHNTCLVDLNFQNGACADYLDLEPRLDLKEIEPSGAP
jgi:pilus assembly protein CpaE